MVMNRVFKDLIKKKKRYKVFYGGRAGGKSTAFAQSLLIIGTQKKVNVLCTREIQNSIRDSVHSLLRNIVEKEPALASFYEITDSYIYGINGTRFFFKGLLRNIESVKSIEGINYCWVEEAQSVSKTSLEVLIPTIREKESEIWFSFNPQNRKEAVYDKFIVNKEPRSLVKKVNYYNNPFNSKTILDEANISKKKNIENYNWIWMGEPRILTEQSIITNWTIQSVPEPEEYSIGMDFGFSRSPTAIVKVSKKGNQIFIHKEIGDLGIELKDFGKYINKVCEERDLIYADSAEQLAIAELCRQGFKVKAVKKWSGSVREGIRFLQDHQIVVDSSCKKTIMELESYKFKVNSQTGEIRDEPIDDNNHYIDALRYALSNFIKPTNKRIFI